MPKTRIVLPLAAYTLIFLLTLGVILLSVELFALYTTSLKANADSETTKFLAETYDQAPEDQKQAVLGSFEEYGYDYLIADNTGRILKHSGNPTILLGSYDDDEDEEYSTLTITVSDPELPEQISSDEYTLDFGTNATYYPDRDTDYLEVNSGSLGFKFLKLLNADFIRDLYHTGSYMIPYWTAFRVNDNARIVAFKTYIDISFTDLLYLAGYFVVAVILVFLIFAVLITNLVSTHRNAKRVKKIVFSDNVTGNRNWLWFVLKSREILKKRKPGTSYAMVSLVFIRYRNYVLCHSVEEGEKMLKEVWAHAESSLDKDEICAHSPSSNFPMLIKAKDEEEARTKLLEIVKELEGIEKDHDFKFQAGVYMIPNSIKKDADIDLFYNNASTARMTLESTEDTGIAFFDNKLVEDEKWIDTVHEKQKDAIANEEFKVYYQPKYDPRTDELKGAEALIRWISEDLGFVSPGKFIPIFEDNGFITEIDHYMLAHVARDQKRWLDEGRECVPVSVNISRAHFVETDLADQIRDIVDKEGAPRNLIEIELTESAFFDDKKVMLSTITKLKEYGFLVSMDDFGSGYSSLNSLKDMPLDILKLDAGFFRGDKDNDRTEIVVSEAIRLAKKLEMKTVAEGVETKEQFNYLRDHNIDIIQGYLLGKPISRIEFEKLLIRQIP